jgi:lipoprotein NlpD
LDDTALMNLTRMKTIRFVFLVILLGLVGACSSTRNTAPIVERSPGQPPRAVAATPKAATRPGEERAYYTVKKSDTLYHIALDLGQNYRDIIAWNNLANPNDIKVDQVLRVLPPDASPSYGGAQAGGVQTGSVTAGSVSTAAAIESRPAPAPAAGAPAATVAPTNPVTNKTGPRGDKRPYSDAAMAELQKPEAVGVPAAAVTAMPAKPAEPKPVEKSAEKTPESNATTPPDEESVSWMWPADGKVVAGFEDNKKGIDIAGQNGQQIVAAASGKVMYAGSGIRGYGNLVIVKHTSNLLSAYAHNKAVLVKEGQVVSKGQKIAEMGNSDADAVKLHFEIRQQGKPADPSKFLPSR